MSTPLRVIHVGLGGWGRSWAEALSGHPDLLTTVAWVDVFPEMLDLLQAELDVDPALCFASLREAIAATDAEAVLVTTALPDHAAVALEALAAGKHVLVEKPMAASLVDAQAMVDAAQAAGLVLMVSQNYRFYPAARAVADLVARKTLGSVGAVSVNFRKLANTTGAGVSRFHASTNPLLLDMSIHHFDLMRFILGQEPVSVACHAWNPDWSNFADHAAAVATVAFDGGAVVNYQGSWVSTDKPTLWAGQWMIECADGSIEWTGRNDLTTDGDCVTVHPLSGPSYPLTLAPYAVFDRIGSTLEFATAIREGRAAETSGSDNLATLALALAAIASSRTGRPEQLPKGNS
ncbi:Predicted dehydrogenase [Nakamurella panacisegetis]|uniref:Predicted dehydrogenase n=1 Tax=Nakamurella panacisegetis TaxID=1090615 RepID=A0A1H0LIC5_9ACTN|nr:Gfo/Idh/MocA family oxidoreductase [Nakamurella panacisegetis]SDO67939.1 Predicted dehydrogenase [Nakamurella panacisegetis]